MFHILYSKINNLSRSNFVQNYVVKNLERLLNYWSKDDDSGKLTCNFCQHRCRSTGRRNWMINLLKHIRSEHTKAHEEYMKQKRRGNIYLFIQKNILNKV